MSELSGEAWTRSRRVAICGDCDRECHHKARGLCSACYERRRYFGTLDQVQRTHLPADWFVEDYEFLRRQGYTRALAAERMGITKKRLEKAIERVQRRMQEAS